MEILQAVLMDPRFKTKWRRLCVCYTYCSCSACSWSTTTKEEKSWFLIQGHDKLSDDVMPVLSKSQQIGNEIQIYLSAARLDFEEDPLMWWKLYCESYPFLQGLACKYLCVCATRHSIGEVIQHSRGHSIIP